MEFIKVEAIKDGYAMETYHHAGKIFDFPAALCKKDQQGKEILPSWLKAIAPAAAPKKVEVQPEVEAAPVEAKKKK